MGINRRRWNRGIGLMEYIGSLTVLTVFLSGYFTLANRKAENLAFNSARCVALAELSTRLERIRAGQLEEQEGLSPEPLPGEPEGWTLIWCGPLTNPEGVERADRVRIYKRPYEQGLDELAVMVFWRSMAGHRLHVRADTLRRKR